MILDPQKDIDGFSMINRAGSILSSYGLKEEAHNIHQEASICGYDDYQCLFILKKYVDIS